MYFGMFWSCNLLSTDTEEGNDRLLTETFQAYKEWAFDIRRTDFKSFKLNIMLAETG